MGSEKKSLLKYRSFPKKDTPVNKKIESNSPSPPLFTLQRTLGNSAFRGILQTKLKVNEPGDIYEKEADRVADAVVNSTAPNIQMQMIEEETIQRKCSACEKEEELQMKSKSGQAAGIVSSEVSQKIQNAGGGNRLSSSVNSEMSQKMGADFTNVNIHTGSESARLNQSLGARAFTHGKDIFFNSGEYNPESKKGKRLLAHELTHVVQQSFDKKSKTIRLQEEIEGNNLAAEPGGPGRIEVHSNGIVRLWNFDQGDPEPKSAHLLVLAQLCNYLKQILGHAWPHAISAITGYASPEGREKKNDTLSLKRAKRVVDHLEFLLEQHGLSGSTSVFWVEGVGEQEGATVEWPYLRRVDVEISPINVTNMKSETIKADAPEGNIVNEIELPDQDYNFKDFGGDGYDILNSLNTLLAATGIFNQANPAFLLINGLKGWAGAMETGDNITWSISASYAMVAFARGDSPPPYSEDFDHSYSEKRKEQASIAWSQGITDTRKRMHDEPEVWRNTARAIQLMNPETALNKIYQQLVSETLEHSYLIFIPAGGVGYEMAKSYYLLWPGPSWSARD